MAMTSETNTPPRVLPSDGATPLRDHCDTDENLLEQTEANLNTQALLKAEIESVIDKYKHDRRYPPFMKADLVVMAIVCIDKAHVTKQEIYLWILRSFKYLGDKAHEAFATAATKRSSMNRSPADFVNADSILGASDELFNRYEIPLCRTSSGSEISTHHSAWFSVPVNTARVFLRSALEPPRLGFFRFLDLPTELRVRIYEMVLSYPELIIGSAYSNGGIQVLEREHEATFNKPVSGPAGAVSSNEADGNSHARCTIDCAPTRLMLSLLSVNKQIYSEALPVFYSINHFRFYDVDTVAMCLGKMPLSRLEHLRHLSLPYGIGSSELNELVQVALSNLIQHARVIDLEIVSSDSDLAKAMLQLDSNDGLWATGLRDLGSYLNISELVRLAQSADKVSFRADCRQLEEYVRVRIEKGKE